MDTRPELTAKGRPRQKRVRTVTGCLLCRQRRVKCDEQRPKCTNCSRHPNRVCQYQYEATTLVSTGIASDTFVGMGMGIGTNSGLPPPSIIHYPSSSLSFPTAGLGDTASLSSMPISTMVPFPYPVGSGSLAPLSSTSSSPALTKSETNVSHTAISSLSSSSASSLPSSSSSALTLTSSSASDPMSITSSNVPDEPYLAARYQDVFVERMVMGLLENEYRTLNVLKPYGSSSALADTLISKLPFAESSPFRTLLTYHAALVRRCFDELAHDPEARLLCSVTALFSTGHLDGRRDDLFRDYLRQVRGKGKGNEAVTGKLGAAGFTLFLSQVLSPIPGRWKEQLRVNVEWALARGGPGWIMGVAPPLPGYRGGDLQNYQPLAMAMYSDFTAILVVFASLSDGTLPMYVNVEQRSWLLASRALQVKLSPSMPDLFEALLAVPRIMMPTFAQAVALASRRLVVDEQPEMLKEQLEFEAASLRVELEHVWPSRLDMRPDGRRLQYGSRIWRLAILILLIQKAQLFSTRSPEVATKVASILELLSEAATDIGHLTGWLWPVLIAACAAVEPEHRDRFRALLPLAKSPIGDRDSSDVVNKILTLVYAHQDVGMQTYHVKEAIHDDPSLDVLLL